MSESLQQLHDEHRDTARLLNLLEKQLRRSGGSRPPDRGLSRDILHYLTHYSDLFHHPREELIFAQVAEYDPPLRELLASLSHEHRLLARQGAGLYRDLSTFGDAERWAHQLGCYLTRLRTHMHREEDLVFNRALEVLAESDWVRVETEMMSHTGPLFGGLLAKQYRLRYQHILGQR